MIWCGWLAAAVVLGILFPAQQGLALAQEQERCTLAVGVFNSTTHAPLPRTLVSYTGPDSGYRFTDANGNIRIEDLSCGSYSLSISKPGFVSSAEQAGWRDALLNPAKRNEFDAEFTAEAGRKLAPLRERVKLTSSSSSVRVALLPVSSIEGVVLSDNGEPLEGVSVQAIAAKAFLTDIDYVLARTATTDDRGRYMLLDLVPGDYIVRLAGRASSIGHFSGFAPNVDRVNWGIPSVYYPDANTFSGAAVLHLVPGEHRAADFQHAVQPAVDIDGRLTGFVPDAWTKMELFADTHKIPLGSVSVNVSTGRFHVNDLSAGSYTLRVLQRPTDPPRWLAAEESLVVETKPLDGLIIPLSRGVNIPVSVSYEAGAGAGELVQVMLQAQHTHKRWQLMTGGLSSRLERSDAVSQSEVPQERTLTNVIPDHYRLNVILPDKSKDYVASATLGDTDVLHGNFWLGANLDVKLNVTIRGDSASVEGKVMFQGRPAPGAQVYLISATEDEDWIGVALSDQQAQFRIQGIPPGEFRIRAWIGSPPVSDLLSGRGKFLTLRPGQNRVANLDATRASATE